MQFDPEVSALFAAAQAANLPTLDQLDVATGRAFYKAQIARAGAAPAPMESVRDLEAPGPAGPIPLRLYRPLDIPESPAPLLVFFHGGGWVVGDLDTHDTTCRSLAAGTGCLVCAVGYRLAPEHPAPAATADALAALQWIAANAAALGADGHRLAVGGDSAGGNLAAVAALAARDGGPPLRAQILIYPSVDLRDADAYPSRTEKAQVPPLTDRTMRWFTSRYLNDAAPVEGWQLSPMAAPDKAGVAPATVITAEHDALRDEGRAYADALEAAGVPVHRIEVPGMIHGFINMGGALSAAGRVLDAVAGELRARFA